MQEITIRKMDFDFPDVIDPIVIAGHPEESYLMIGLSLLLPYLEPYLIRTMKEARKHLRDPDLVAELGKFSGQEGQHYKQHNLFNESCKAFGIAYPDLARLEAELDDDYRRFSGTKSLRWNLAYAEGFEALTTAFARTAFEEGSNPNTHPAARDLFAWHLVEELEHRTVAFDVFDDACGSYRYRLAVGTWAQWHMGRWIARVTRHMLDSDARALEEYGGVEGRKARRHELWRRAYRGLLPKLFRTYSPRYTPHEIEFTEEMRDISKMFSATAQRTS
jgi:predicted metal-dependent hydrolase